MSQCPTGTDRELQDEEREVERDGERARAIAEKGYKVGG